MRSSKSNSAESTDLESWVHRLQRSRRNGPSVTRVRHVPAREPRWGEFPPSIRPWLRDALKARGAERPYSHQAEAWTAIGNGENVVVVTPTASGKTLCYNVPTLAMLRDAPDGAALYIYPTKALAQDQCAEINELIRSGEVAEEAHVYDGDTPADLRRRIRETTRVVLTNPDMLHSSVLPNHELWRRLFSSLRVVVIDEMHAYRGVFGSHVANVIRRLRRVCAHYGTSPVFVLASATIANPRELAERIVGAPVTLIDQNGAPAGERFVMLYNPPMLDVELQRRQSPGAAAQYLALPLLEQQHATIIFARSRQGVEIITRRLKESLEEQRKAPLARRIEGYRAGYLPQERRRIERALRDGSVLGVVSTNALELGIDIGSLDVCIMAGYPGTIASTWQQAGRAGRRQGKALAILIAGEDPVDQYIVNNPDFFFGAPPEHARIDPDNLRILSEHIKCAAFELPMRTDEGFGTASPEVAQEVLAWLGEEGGIVHPEGELWRWNGEGYPAQSVNIRDIHDENFVIVDTSSKKHEILGEIDFEAAHTTVYENAIYQHAAHLYEVHRLDYPDRKAYVRGVEPEYFTQAIDQTRIFVLETFEEHPAAQQSGAGFGEIRVTKRFVGYKKIRFRTFENIGYGEIHLPDLEKHTTSYWCEVPVSVMEQLAIDQNTRNGALQGISHALHTVAIVHVMCARSDLLVTVASRDGSAWEQQPGESRVIATAPRLGAPAQQANADLPVPLGEASVQERPAIFLYDRYPGGVGFSERLYELHDTLLEQAAALIARCDCPAGCPACVGPPDMVTPGGKKAALAILTALR